MVYLSYPAAVAVAAGHDGGEVGRRVVERVGLRFPSADWEQHQARDGHEEKEDGDASSVVVRPGTLRARAGDCHSRAIVHCRRARECWKLKEPGAEGDGWRGVVGGEEGVKGARCSCDVVY